MKLVTYDVDGTLYSLPRLKRRLFWHALLGLKPRVRRSEISDFLRMHAWIDAQRPLRSGRVDPEGWAAWSGILMREQEMFREFLPRIGPRPEIVAMLEEGRARGSIQVALSDLEARYKIDSLGLAGYFSDAVSAESLGHWKPSPEPFRMLQERYGVSPSDHVHVGDRESTDGEGARAAGCRFVLI